ncbi:MAG TPA: GTP 3',8-cyclase MoaA [Desulfomonilaceae bacterium]|nr:GTP 3',8-cyclase MoaA [Desulfomonilaceae bacterium]
MPDILVDPHARVIDYLRVSITDLCNLRCVYCRPPEGIKLVSHDDILRYEEILTVIGLARDLGIRKIRITGGEPLVRRGVLEFLSKLTAMQGIEDVGLTTNGVFLAANAAGLKAAGLTRINVSLDSMRRQTFAEITGSDCLDKVLDGIDCALREGLNPVKINVVLLAGINESDVPAFARLTLDHPVDVRFIERMPFGADSLPDSPDSFSAFKALELIRREVGQLEAIDRDALDGPATMFRLSAARGRIGVIDPVTGHFCGTCNRLRLTARGTLRPCLLSPREIDIKAALRNAASRDELVQIIRQAVFAKPIGQPSSSIGLKDGMNMIGG